MEEGLGRQTGRQTGRQASKDTQAQREKDNNRDRELETHRDTDTEIQTQRQTDRPRQKHRDIQRFTCRARQRQSHTEADRQTEKTARRVFLLLVLTPDPQALAHPTLGSLGYPYILVTIYPLFSFFLKPTQDGFSPEAPKSDQHRSPAVLCPWYQPRVV